MKSKSEQQAAAEAFNCGYHDISDPKVLNAMAFAELAALLWSCEKDSPKFLVIEREIKRHIAKDQAQTNRPNILLGAGIAGVFGFAGIFVGAWLKESPPSQLVTPASIQAVQPSSGATPAAITINKPASGSGRLNVAKP